MDFQSVSNSAGLMLAVKEFDVIEVVNVIGHRRGHLEGGSPFDGDAVARAAT